MTMPPDFAKVGDGQPTVGGKRWGLRLKDSVLPWNGCDGTIVEWSSCGIQPVCFGSPDAAERYRIQYKNSFAPAITPDNLVVVDLDSGEVIPPDDPRLKPPTVDGEKPAKPGSMGYVIRRQSDGLYYQSNNRLGCFWVVDPVTAARFPFATLADRERKQHMGLDGFEVVDLATLRAVGAINATPPTVDGVDQPAGREWKAGNRAVVRDDPGLILCGQRVYLCGKHTYKPWKPDPAWYCSKTPNGPIDGSADESDLVGTWDDPWEAIEIDSDSLLACPNITADSPEDDPTDDLLDFQLYESDVNSLSRAIDFGLKAVGHGDSGGVARAFGIIEGMLAGAGLWELHEGEDESC